MNAGTVVDGIVDPVIVGPLVWVVGKTISFVCCAVAIDVAVAFITRAILVLVVLLVFTFGAVVGQVGDIVGVRIPDALEVQKMVAPG